MMMRMTTNFFAYPWPIFDSYLLPLSLQPEIYEIRNMKSNSKVWVPCGGQFRARHCPASSTWPRRSTRPTNPQPPVSLRHWRPFGRSCYSTTYPTRCLSQIWGLMKTAALEQAVTRPCASVMVCRATITRALPVHRDVNAASVLASRWTGPRRSSTRRPSTAAPKRRPTICAPSMQAFWKPVTVIFYPLNVTDAHLLITGNRSQQDSDVEYFFHGNYSTVAVPMSSAICWTQLNNQFDNIFNGMFDFIYCDSVLLL